jgi:hypothetical protein
MKKLLLLLAIVKFSVLSAQPTHKFLDADTWYQRVDNFGSITYFWYYKAGDTLMNGYTYTRIHSLPSFINYFVREDTVTKKVFIKYVNPANADILLYDFNLFPGASFQVLGTLNTVVDSIVSYPLLCGNRYRYYLSDSTGIYQFSFIEEVGSVIDPFKFCGFGTDPVLNLVCNYEGNAVCYQWANDTCATNPFVGISTYQLPLTSFRCFPTPFSDKLNFAFDNNELSEIILYDIASRKLLQQKFTNSVSINTEQLAKGIYLYEVRCGSSLCKKGKVVKD